MRWPPQHLTLELRNLVLQVILDSHGEVAARICSILAEKGYLEADAIAEMAMVPAKDTREVRPWFCVFLQIFVS